MRRSTLALAAALALVAGTDARPRPAPPPAAGENPVAALEPLLGVWGLPADVVAQRPELAERVVHDYAWTVGENALRVREGYLAGAPEASELDGLVYWHPQREELQLTAVAGHGAGEGRLFQGTYRALDDGRIERVYEVFYRTPEDMPGAELGGTSRRYREVYTIAGDALAATLEWWRDEAWRPFGPGTYALVRLDG